MTKVKVNIKPRNYEFSAPILVGGKNLIMVLMDGKGKVLYDVTNNIELGYVDTVPQMLELITAGYSGTILTCMSDGDIVTKEKTYKIPAIWFVSQAKKIYEEGITEINLVESNYR